ncbi:hypothetical protein EUGRSUZ_E04325 [Eucalyptus grandis]|uniref:Uncharacterized protein n=2 Tax=Eucalyptus grandis TaxID=71139 RepID=A0ACC3L3L0_EUCGR|nr:hypothetical protein EUGRSUZ_E04325 [Eucalyptus grandis]
MIFQLVPKLDRKRIQTDHTNITKSRPLKILLIAMLEVCLEKCNSHRKSYLKLERHCIVKMCPHPTK